jgi:transcriptional regulator with XRE-family HTH domain
MTEKLSPAGKAFRGLRIQHDRTMAEHARHLKCSTSFISQVETGKIPIPPDYVRQFCDWLGLDERTERDLQAVVDAGQRIVRIVPADEERAALACEFSRSLNGLLPETLHQLRLLLDTAHKKKFTEQEIEDLALTLRKMLGLDDKVLFDVLRIVENIIAQAQPNFFLGIRERRRLGKVRAYSDNRTSEAPHIVVADDVYESASNHGAAARKTLLHEFAHFLLHKGVHTDGGHHGKENSAIERQAKYFVRWFAFPPHIAARFKDSEEAARVCRLPAFLTEECWTQYELQEGRRAA